ISVLTTPGYRNDSPRAAAWQAWTRSWSATDFRTYPQAPALKASKKYCSLSYIESINILGCGVRRAISLAACNPVIVGIATSSTARSTSSLRASWTASAPSLASATTRRPGLSSRISRTPRRTRAWSSASRMRTSLLTGPPCPAAPAAAPRRHLPGGAPSGACRRRPTPVPAAVVNHRQDDRRPIVTQVEVDGGGVGMPGRVGQRLLRHPEDDQFDLWRQRRKAPLDSPAHLHSRLGGQLVRHRGQRRHQSQVLQHPGPQAPSQAPHLL